MNQRKRVGRPAGKPRGQQREIILTAARELFSVNGFRETTMRAIAGRAGVDVSLVAHYFTNKQGLFAATLQLPDHARDEMLSAMETPLGRRGEALTRAFLGLWEDPETGAQMRSVSRTALSSQELGHKLESVFADILTGADAPEGTPASRTITEAAWAQLLGVATARYLHQVPTLANLPFDDLVAMISPGIQTTLDLGKSALE